jgi:hypothetical protein
MNTIDYELIDYELNEAVKENNMPEIGRLLRAGVDLNADASDSELSKCLIQKFYATSRRLPIHDLLEDLTWIANPNGGSGAPRLRFALDELVTDDVVEILEYLVGQNPAWLRARDCDGSLPLHVACLRGASFTIVQSLVDLYTASVKSRTPQGDLPLFLACEMPEPTLDTIYILMELYPDLVYR